MNINSIFFKWCIFIEKFGVLKKNNINNYDKSHINNINKSILNNLQNISKIKNNVIIVYKIEI